ncbi:MAG: polysaccharide biosynthesis tyrosine autokinase, partial [Solirubrobacteraceae bacterium]
MTPSFQDSPADRNPVAAVPSSADIAVRRRIRRVVAQWPLILACAFLAAIAGYVLSSSRPAAYEASSDVGLQSVDLVSLLLSGNTATQSDLVQRDLATGSQMIGMAPVRERTVKMLGDGTTLDDLAKDVTVTTSLDTNVLTITARDSSAKQAQKVADATANAFIDQRAYNSRLQIKTAAKKLLSQYHALNATDRASATGQALQDRWRQLTATSAVATGGVQVLQEASANPAKQVAPKPAFTAILGLFGGGILGLVAAFLRAGLDDRIRDPKEFTELWPLPVAGHVPRTKVITELAHQVTGDAALEAFAMTRTNLRYLHVGGDIKTIVVTSAQAQEGKTTVAWNLASVTALAGSRVLLIEADLRRPVLAQRLGVAARAGLSEILAGMAGIEDALIKLPRDSDDLGPRPHVILAGAVPPSPMPLFERGALASLLQTLKPHYDLIIIDTPPATVVADALTIIGHVDAAVAVARLGTVTHERFTELRDVLNASPTPVAALV